MKAFDWADLLHHHPIFSALNEQDVRWFLQDEVSRERDYPAGTEIIHMGEVGDSLFLVGSGSVEAVLPLDGDKRLSLAVMRRGEIFGEMAFLEGRPRSATVVVREAGVLLEISGHEFRKLLDPHPDIEVKVLLKVSERLRNANDQILNVHLRGVDEKLRLFNEKLDVEHRIVDTSLRAAQTVFDQTKQRADEVISSFERTRTMLQVTASIVGGVVTLLVTGLGYFGYNELKSVRDMGQQVRSDADAVKTELKTVREATRDLENTRRQLDDTKKVMLELLHTSFSEAVSKEDVVEAMAAYTQLRGLLGPNQSMPESLFSYIELRIRRTASGPPADWSDLLKLMAEDSRKAGTDRQEAWAYYLLLAHTALARPDDFDGNFTRFREIMAQQKSRGVKADRIDKEMLERLSDLFASADSRKRQSFEKVVLVARSL